MIAVHKLCKAFGGKTVLQDFSCELEEGRVTALMAPSGAGKTTLLRILLGLETADSGEITGLSGKRLAAVFQEDRLLEQHDLHPQTCFTTRDGFTTYNMVEAGLGVSFNQRLISRKWSGTVAEVPFDPPQFVTLGISVPSLREASPAAKKFIACAIETVTGGEKSL